MDDCVKVFLVIVVIIIIISLSKSKERLVSRPDDNSKHFLAKEVMQNKSLFSDCISLGMPRGRS